MHEKCNSCTEFYFALLYCEVITWLVVKFFSEFKFLMQVFINIKWDREEYWKNILIPFEAMNSVY